jgi:hypothetical protein
VKLNQFNNCIKDCTMSMDFSDTMKGKCLFRRGVANRRLQRWAEAEADLRTCSEIYKDTEALCEVRVEMESLMAQIALQHKKRADEARMAMTVMPEWCKPIQTRSPLRELTIARTDLSRDIGSIYAGLPATPTTNYVPKALRMRDEPKKKI